MPDLLQGIYQIRNVLTDDIYIGSTLNFAQRKRQHLASLRKNIHHSIILQRAWNKYGEENFDICFIQQTNEANLLYVEQSYLNLLCPKYNILNIAGSTKGRKHTEKAKLAISKAFSKPILQYTGEGKFIKEWSSSVECEKFLNIPQSSIRGGCIGRSKKVHGFIFKYKNDVNSPYEDLSDECLNKLKHNSKSKQKYYEISHSGGMVIVIKNLAEFCRLFNLKQSLMVRASTKGYQHKGFRIKNLI